MQHQCGSVEIAQRIHERAPETCDWMAGQVLHETLRTADTMTLAGP